MFQPGATGSYGLYTGVYLWSNTANWVGGNQAAQLRHRHIQRQNTAPATRPASTTSPTSYLDMLTMPTGYLAVVGSLQIGKLSLGNSGGNIFASTIAGNAAATLTIDGLTGSSGIIIGARWRRCGHHHRRLAPIPARPDVADEAVRSSLTLTPSSASTFEFGN